MSTVTVTHTLTRLTYMSVVLRGVDRDNPFGSRKKMPWVGKAGSGDE